MYSEACFGLLHRSGKELMDDHSWPLLDPMIGVNTTLTKKVQAIACTVAE